MEAQELAKNPTIENLRPWKPGQSGNPHGLSIVLPELLRLQRLTREEMALILSWMLKGKANDILNLVNDPNATILQRAIASIFGRILKTGDSSAFEALMTRCIGKVPQPKELPDTPPEQEDTIGASTSIDAEDRAILRAWAKAEARDRALGGSGGLASLGDQQNPEGGQPSI